MQVSIKSRYFSDEKRDLIINFAKWCGIKLLGKRLDNNISLLIHIVGPNMYNKDGFYALTDVHPDDDWHRPRNFTITMTNKFEILRSLMIVAYEMVHIKQHAKQELAFCGRTGLPKWQGIRAKNDTVDYWDLPWEIEAHGREKGLVYQWANECNHIDKPWFKEIF